MKPKYVIILLLLVFSLSSCSMLFKKGFPEYSGKKTHNELKESVEIYRDEYGIPHIYAKNEYDAYFAQGYVHAQDRLWQMETTRRFAKGRLSEIAGKSMLKVDMLGKLLGFDELIKSIALEDTEKIKEVKIAYISGINAYIKEKGKNLPIEFASLKIKPEPYTEDDFASLLIVNTWLLQTNLEQELFAIKTMDRFNAQDFAELFSSYTNAKYPADEYFDSIRKQKVAPFLKEADFGQSSSSAQESNCWAISSQKSSTGNAIFANDPHLSHSVPGVWYLVHIVCPSMNVMGVSMPGTPGIIIGHNESVAWGMTNVMTDYVDLYVVKVDPQQPTKYYVDGKQLEMEKKDVTISVKGEQPIKKTIYKTIYGSIITTMEKGYDAQVAIKWYGAIPDNTSSAYYNISHAKNVNDVLNAGKDFGMVCLNLTSADDQGNIGWHVTDKTPIRKGYSGRLPADGSQSAFGWNGFVSYDKLPFAFNPKNGSIVTANNRTVEEDYPYLITCSWIAPYRADRIKNLINSKPKLNADDQKDIQSDVYSVQAEKIISKMLDISPKDRNAKFAIESIRNWDKKITSDSWQASIYEMLIISLNKNILSDEMGDDFDSYLELSAGSMFIENILSNANSHFWDMINTPSPEVREQIIEKSLSDAITILSKNYGENRKKWKWGNMHQIKFEHPGATNWLTKKYMNAGSYPIGGDSSTVNVSLFKQTKHDYSVYLIPSMRMIVDFEKKPNGQIIIPMGQSGQPQHPHYKDMINLWLENKYIPMYFDRNDVLSHKKELLLLSGNIR